MSNLTHNRLNGFLFTSILISVILYFGRFFLVPLFFACLFSMLLLPIANVLEKRGIGRKLSTTICILIIVFFVAAIITLLTNQAASFSNDLPLIHLRVQELIDNLQEWVQQQFSLSPERQVQFIKEQISRLSESANTWLTGFISGFFKLIGNFILMLLYFFFLMWKREKYENFILRLVTTERQEEVKYEISEITKVASQYVVGRLVSFIFLITVYAIGFIIIGMKNAVLVSIIAVLPTVVPYIGAYVGGLIPVLVTLATGSPGSLLPVLLLLVGAQTFDNNIIEPLAEGESLNLSPIFTIIALVLGNFFWGIAGMVLFVPMFAIIRIICEYSPSLNPYGYLLASDVDEAAWIKKFRHWVKGKKT